MLEIIERCILCDDILELKKLAFSSEWEIVYSVAVRLGKLKGSMNLIFDILKKEDEYNLYTQPPKIPQGDAGGFKLYDLGLADVDLQTKKAWERRGRIKQACLLSLGEIGEYNDEILDYINNACISKKDDYIVRSAACKVLGIFKDKRSLDYLKKAIDDDEWCTKHEAKNSYQIIIGEKKSV